MDAKSRDTEFESLRQDLNALREDLAKLTEALNSDKKDSASSLKEELRRETREAWKNVRSRGDEALDRAREYGSGALQDVERQIEERPLLTLLIIFLVGLVIGRLSDHR